MIFIFMELLLIRFWYTVARTARGIGQRAIRENDREKASKWVNRANRWKARADYLVADYLGGA
jgi:hypothetical protein